MSVCEHFEKEFGRLQSGALTSTEAASLTAHASQCPHCSTYSNEQSNLRILLSSQPSFQPRPGFERRLTNRINGNTEVYRLSPKRRMGTGWAAIGAGLATGLAVGFFVMLAPHSTDNMAVTTAAPLAAAGIKAKTDSIASIQDSATAVESLYKLDQNSRTVSSGR